MNSLSRIESIALSKYIIVDLNNNNNKKKTT